LDVLKEKCPRFELESSGIEWTSLFEESFASRDHFTLAGIGVHANGTPGSGCRPARLCSLLELCLPAAASAAFGWALSAAGRGLLTFLHAPKSPLVSAALPEVNATAPSRMKG
jgi:hypothetical protein